MESNPISKRVENGTSDTPTSFSANVTGRLPQADFWSLV